MTARNTGSVVGLPPRFFLYTIDQIALMLEIGLPTLRTNYIHFDGRSIGSARHKMMARNIAAPDDLPDWRISEPELVRWMKSKGFRFTERGWLKS